MTLPWVIVAIAGILLLQAVTAPAERELAAGNGEPKSWPLHVNVEQNGKPRTGLDGSNFRVFLDDRGQQFDIEPLEIPASVVFLIEAGPRTWPHMQEVHDAVKGFLDEAPTGNWYGLMTFDRSARVVVDFTKQRHQVSAALLHLQEPQDGEVATYDALCNILDTMSELPGRRVIIFIGSGMDNFSGHSFGDVERKLESADVMMYSVGIDAWPAGDDASRPMFEELSLLQVRGFLSMLARKSGGDVWFPTFPSMFRPVQMVHRASRQTTRRMP